MFVDYSAKGASKITNKIFAEKLLDLIFLDTLDDNQVLEFVKARLLTNQFMQQLSLDNIYGNRYWLYYILSLKLSNEQMEEALDELIVSRLLYQVELTFPGCSFEAAYEMKEFDPMRKIIVDLYISSIFLKCKINSYIKEFTKLVTSDKRLMMLLSEEERCAAFPEYFCDEKKVHEGLIVTLPIKFPKTYLSLLQSDGTMKTNIKLQFQKWELADKRLLYSRNIHIRDVVTREKDVQLRWIQNNQLLKPRTRKSGDTEQSETSIMLRDIHRRHMERQKVMKSVNEKIATTDELLPNEPKPDFLKIFDDINEEIEQAIENDEKVINKTQEIRNRVKQGSIVLPSEIEYLKDPSTHDILKPVNTNQIPQASEKLKYKRSFPRNCENGASFKMGQEYINNGDDEVDDYEFYSDDNINMNNRNDNSNSNNKRHSHSPYQEQVQNYNNAAMTYSNIAYVPALNNLETPDVVLRLSCKHSSSTLRKRLAGLVRSPFNKKDSSTGYLDDTSLIADTWSRLSFRFFLKAKLRKIKQDWQYYKNVAKQCMDDFRSPSEGLGLPPQSATAFYQQAVQISPQGNNISKFLEPNNCSMSGANPQS
ncbi:Irc10p Ecym_2727 [Eremothecium cymbalariae DBVPG|uniref:Uncharacterized protein n=1 Tax=Eremothecium cymbalariae (strain CBS 270.75 / DBVPG 7215 / KCTC 17166 / NRRL Y-17582) TaxID=931890 RepID=G8JPG2_ERECY|nr:Hypothetical protein Ecym_2727 [Eremothecium cymbalariae DBVPG\